MKIFLNSSIDLQTPWAGRRPMGQVRFQLEAIQSPCPQSSQCTVLRWKFQVHDQTADSSGSLSGKTTRNLASFRSSIHVYSLFMSNCNRRCRELGFPTKCNRYAMFIYRYILVLYFIVIIVFVESSLSFAVMQSCSHATTACSWPLCFSCAVWRWGQVSNTLSAAWSRFVKLETCCKGWCVDILESWPTTPRAAKANWSTPSSPSPKQYSTLPWIWNDLNRPKRFLVGFLTRFGWHCDRVSCFAKRFCVM